MSDHGTRISINGRQLSFVAAGDDGPDILLLHGFGSDRLSWALNQAALATFAQTCAVDLPGHGASDANVGSGSIRSLGLQIAGLIRARNRQPTHLIGHSLGGAIAIDIAHRFPKLVGSLFLIAPAGLGHGIDPFFLEDFTRLNAIDQAETLLRRLVERPRLITRPIAQRTLDQLNRPGARENLTKIADALSRVGTTMAPAIAAVARTTRPRLVVWGRDDAINPIDEDLVAGFGGRHIPIDGARHLPQIENPAYVNRLARDFYAGI